MEIVAHRGASLNAPENSMPAFRLAWVQGSDAIKGDFHLTKDDKIVCMHDDNTGKIANKSLVIKKSTLGELKRLDISMYHGKNFKFTRIPTLEEVIESIPLGKKIYIEIKCGVEIFPPLLEKIGQSGLKKDQIVVISSKKNVIEQFKLKSPQYKAYWLVSLKERKSGEITPSLNKVLTTLEQIKADGLSSNMSNIDEEFIKNIIKKGYEFHIWTVDDIELAQRFKRWGAKSITTNVPGKIKKELIS